MVQPVLRVTVVHRVLKATKERRAQLEPQVLGVHAVRRVAKANRVLKAPGEIQVQRVHVVGTEIRAI